MPRLTAAQKAEAAAAAAADEQIGREVITAFYESEVTEAAEKLAQARAAVVAAETAMREAEQRRDAWTTTGEIQTRPHWPAGDTIHTYAIGVAMDIGQPILANPGRADEATRTAYFEAKARADATDRYLTAIGHPKTDFDAKYRR